MSKTNSMRFFPFLVYTVAIACTFQNVLGQGLTEIELFGKNEGNLRLFVHEVESDANSTIPLVVVLHGCSQNAEKVAAQSGWNELADKYGFMVIYPEQKMANNVSSCFNWFNKTDINPLQGESSSILEMIQYTTEHFNINRNRIFIYGLSAGAAMTVNLLASSPETFYAGASLAGGPFGMASNFMQAARAMVNPPIKTADEWGKKIPESNHGKFPKLVVLHGTADHTVDYRNAEELIKQWTNIHQIESDDYKRIEHFAENSKVEKRIYPENSDEGSIYFYSIEGLGHSLPVYPGELENQGGQTGMFAENIHFFSTYYIAKDFGLIPQ